MTDETKGTSPDSGANSEGSGNSRGFIQGMPLQAFQAHQTAMDDLFNEVHGKIKESSDEGKGLAKAISQYQNGDMVWGNSLDEVEKKISSLPDNGGGGGGGSGGSDGNSGGGGDDNDDSGDGDEHGIAYGLVDRNTGTIVNVVMQGGERDREDVLDAMLAAVSHLRKELRNEEEAAKAKDSEELGKLAEAFDELEPDPKPLPEMPEMSVLLALPSFGQREEICMLAKNCYGATMMQIVRADTFPVLSSEFTDRSCGDVAACLDEDIMQPEFEFCFEPAMFNIPAGQYFARCMDSTGRVAVSKVFTIERDPLRNIKSFCQKSGWGYSTVHKAINDGTIPRHLVVEKTKSCSKRRVYMSADQCLSNAGKRKCRKHRRPNRRARTA